MARKVENRFHAEIRLNGEKGGAWLTTITLHDDTGAITLSECSAWKNASAAKRWVKERVKALTPRKSVVMLGSNLNDKNKPTVLTGSVIFKVAS